MRICLLILLAIVALSTLACGVILEEPTTRSRAERTPDVEATIEAAVEATREVEISIEATIAERVEASRSAQPEATLTLASEPTTVLPPSPTRRAAPVPFPTATPLPFLPTPTPLPFLPTPTPLPTLPPLEILSLSEYADRHAGGPGAIYIGDLNQLAGPAVTVDFMAVYGTDLGDGFGQVPLYALQQHRWIYETDYYQSLLDRARLTKPTQLISRGERIYLQHTCINTQLFWCKHLKAYFAPNVEARTNGQVTIEVTSFPELGLAGTDTAVMLADGVLDMSEVYGGYVGGGFPTLALQYMWGLWPDHQTHFAVQASIAPEIDRTIAGEMGAQVLMRNWIAGDDQFIFSDHRLNSPQNFHGLMTRSHSAELSDWLNHMGAKAQFLAFSEVYTALERDIIDAAVTGSNPGLSQRWFEVVDNMNGPLTSFNSTTIAINDQVWDGIPGDLQQILIEEGAKYELEALRLASIQNLTPLQRSIAAGLKWVEFTPDLRWKGFESAVEGVIPAWLKRLGSPGSGNRTVMAFNEHVGPYVGLYVDENGAVVRTDVSRGPHAGKTMEQVLSE